MYTFPVTSYNRKVYMQCKFLGITKGVSNPPNALDVSGNPVLIC